MTTCEISSNQQCNYFESLYYYISTFLISQALDYRNSFEGYSYLWVDDRQEFLDQFLLYGHVLTTEEIEAAGDEGVPHTPPNLDQYKEQVDTYEKIYMDVKEFEVCKKKTGKKLAKLHDLL